MIRFEQVGFSFGEHTILQDVSFQLQPGDFAALIGSNGAGKSTVSRLCRGLLKPNCGQILLEGTDLRKLKASALAKSMGFLFQNPDRQICQNTVRGELMFGLQYTVADPQEREERCERTLAQFGFDGGRDPFGMSRGERQRVALASLLAGDPKLLILDEPTTGLDYRECMQILSLIAERNAAGVTVLMVSHDMELVQDFARRVLVLHGGRLLGDGPTNEVMTDLPLLTEARVLPAQIPALSLRLGAQFQGVCTAEEMADRIAERGRR